MGQVPHRLAVRARGGDHHPALAQIVQRRDHVGRDDGVVGAGHPRHQLALGARHPQVAGRDQRAEERARDRGAVRAQLVLEHVAQVLAEDRRQPAEAIVQRAVERAVAARVVEHAAGELQVRRVHRRRVAPAQLRREPGGRGGQIGDQHIEQRRRDRHLARGEGLLEHRAGDGGRQRPEPHQRQPGRQSLRAIEQPRQVLLADAPHHRHRRVARPARQVEAFEHRGSAAGVVRVGQRGLDLIDQQHQPPRRGGDALGEHLGQRAAGRTQERRDVDLDAGAARDVDDLDVERAQPRDQAGAEQRRLAGAGGRDVRHRGAEQHLLEQSLDLGGAAVEVAAVVLAERRGVKFGRLRFPDAQMSTRKGNIILFEDLLEKAELEVLRIIKDKNPSLKNKEKIANKVALASIIYHDLQNNRLHDIIFNWENALSFEGKSGPYILYTYARASSILRKANKKKSKLVMPKSLNEKEFLLAKKINSFPEIVEKSAKDYSPHHIAEYSYELSQSFNEFYHVSQVIGSEEENFRLELIKSFQETLKKSLNLLGIETVEEM